jgi:hypothetical protein
MASKRITGPAVLARTRCRFNPRDVSDAAATRAIPLRLPRGRLAPDLDSLRQQLGDAVFEARIAEARSREEILMRLEATTASGVPRGWEPLRA